MSVVFLIKLGPGPGNAPKWPAGDIYASVVEGNLQLVTGQAKADAFNWYDDQQEGELYTSRGWVIGYDVLGDRYLKEKYAEFGRGLKFKRMQLGGNRLGIEGMGPTTNPGVDEKAYFVLSWDPDRDGLKLVLDRYMPDEPPDSDVNRMALTVEF